MKSFIVYALEGFPLVESGDDIPKMIVDTAMKNGLNLEDGDVVVAAQKIFSKSEGRVFRLEDVVPSGKAEEIAKFVGKSPRLVELVLRETKSILKVAREILLVEDKRGLICINAGIDKSNVKGTDSFALLPEDADRSAETCRARIMSLTGKNVAMIVCDTYSRPFRRGQVNFAIGLAGIKPFKDYRGKRDLFRQLLKVKNVAIADEIAAVAELLMGQATEATPVIIVRGLGGSVTFCEGCNARELQISRDEDLFKNAL